MTSRCELSPPSYQSVDAPPPYTESIASAPPPYSLSPGGPTFTSVYNQPKYTGATIVSTPQAKLSHITEMSSISAPPTLLDEQHLRFPSPSPTSSPSQQSNVSAHSPMSTSAQPSPSPRPLNTHVVRRNSSKSSLPSPRTPSSRTPSHVKYNEGDTQYRYSPFGTIVSKKSSSKLDISKPISTPKHQPTISKPKPKPKPAPTSASPLQANTKRSRLIPKVVETWDPVMRTTHSKTKYLYEYEDIAVPSLPPPSGPAPLTFHHQEGHVNTFPPAPRRLTHDDDDSDSEMDPMEQESIKLADTCPCCEGWQEYERRQDRDCAICVGALVGVICISAACLVLALATGGGGGGGGGSGRGGDCPRCDCYFGGGDCNCCVESDGYRCRHGRICRNSSHRQYHFHDRYR